MSSKWTTQDSTTIPHLLEAACAKWPDKVFLDFIGERYTYKDVDRETTRLAHGLAALGVKKGDRVCSMLGNVADLVFVWFAANKLGAVSVPINFDFKGEYLRHQIADSGARIIVAEEQYAERVFAIENGTPELTTLVTRGARAGGQSRLELMTLDELKSDNTTPIAVSVTPDDLALLIYTSGTTGPSKGCMVGHAYACNFGLANAVNTTMTANDVMYTPCPLFHAAAALGVVISALTTGGAAAIGARFSVTNFWPDVEQSGATMVMLLSIMLRLIPDAPDTEVSRRCHGQIRVLFGAPFPPALKAQWKERFGVRYPATPGYGMTEACPIFVYPCDQDGAPPTASGRQYDGYETRIIGDDGNECPPNVPGEIVLRPGKPGNMFQGYWRRPEATVDAWRDLWFHTGDIGKIDENGFFYFLDRKKDYLRRGGENISSFEVEATFLSHPDIAEAAVHAVPSDMGEDELKVTVVLRPEVDLTEERLCVWSFDRLPQFCIPRYIEFREALPKTQASLRTQKHILRSEGVTAGTWDRQKAGIAVPKRR